MSKGGNDAAELTLVWWYLWNILIVPLNIQAMSLQTALSLKDFEVFFFFFSIELQVLVV